MSTQSMPLSERVSRASAPWFLVVALVFGVLSSGDRSVWSATGGNGGVDPLEILNLSVRPNAIFVLDSSGSMGETLNGNGGLTSDDPDSKMALAKGVIRNVIAANQTRVSFQFGRYTQPDTIMKLDVQTTPIGNGSSFQYEAKNSAATEPFVHLRLYEVLAGSNWTVSFRNGATTYTTAVIPTGVYTGTELAAQIATLMNAVNAATYTGTFSDPAAIGNAPAFTFNRGTGASSFTMRFSAMNATLRGLLGAGAVDVVDSTSPYSIKTGGAPTSFVVSGGPQIRIRRGSSTFTTTLTNTTYTGATLATHIANQMDAADTSSNAVANYDGTFDPASGAFTFTRSGSSTSSFRIDWSAWTASLRTLIGAQDTDATDSTAPYLLLTTFGFPTTAPLALYRGDNDQLSDAGNTYYHLYANKFFNGQTLSVLNDGTPCALVAGTPATSPALPTLTIQRKTTCAGAVTGTTVFTFQGATTWSANGGPNSCGGFESLVPLAPCTNNDQLASIDLPYLQREVRQSGTSLFGYSETNGTGTSTTQTPLYGIRASGSTPIAESLIDLKTVFTTGIWPSVVPQTKKQRTFVIFLTDGDDTCDNDTGQNLSLSAGANALRAAHKAQQLYAEFVPGEPTSSVTTFLVAFGNGNSLDQANWVAWGGSGMIPAGTTGSGAQERWSSAPADKSGCPTCQDAFLATNADELTAKIQAAIDLGQSAGEFSDQQSITETVYEFVDLAPSPTPIASPSPTASPSPFHPLNPVTRYGSSIPVLLQSTFEMPTFNGHLKAFRNKAGVSDLLWDAGTQLVSRVVTDTGAMGSSPTDVYSFAQLYGSATTPDTVRASDARIKRRIFTTSSQGVLSTYTAQNLLDADSVALAGPGAADPTRVELWPPSTAVAPTGNSPAPPGILDGALGLLSASTQAAVQTLVPGACQGSVTGDIFGECTGTTATALARTRREAREILVAYIAGARLLLVNNSLPLRNPSTRELQYVARPWIMAESTLAAPAVVTPPLLSPTLNYKRKEYLLYRDGLRTTDTKQARDGIKNGLGLRNPDLENPQTDQSRDDNDLKPQMSVVYHATNQGLHAFRAGPCPTTAVSGLGVGSIGCSGETGGEELWAFVPFDQLVKLPSVARIQSRSNKTYLLAAPVRITDVFVSASGGLTRTIDGVEIGVSGVWRTLAVFGRGIGGKSLTALDVTVPGPFTWNSLDTYPPIVAWSRGNFDTSDGLVKASGPGGNSYVNNLADYTAYLKMGETWSVPAVGFVDPLTHSGKEFALYVGSGFSDTSSEGKTFFVLDLLTGNVLQNFTLTDGTTATTVSGSALRNVLVASPAVYAVDDAGNSPAGFGFLSNPVEAKAKFVYFGDLHSRVWRYDVATPGVAPTVMADLSGDGDQPFSNALSVIESAKVPNIFFSGGRDSRVPLPPASPFFRMYGYSDATGSTPAPTPPVVQLFARDFPATFRGNSAPAAAFTGGDVDNDPTTPPIYTPVVFFTGLAASTVVGEPCTSSFDSVLFALQGTTGLAAFDLNSQSTNESDDAYAYIKGQVFQNPHVTAEGTLVIDRGLGAQVAPPPPAPPVTAELPPQSETTNVIYGGLTPGTPAYALLRATTVPWRTGSAVCNVK